ncbi:hypothetical protein BH24GEM1_BH24GEM1_18700 [soil metagenome]
MRLRSSVPGLATLPSMALLLLGCGDLLPGRREPAFDPAASADSAEAKESKPRARPKAGAKDAAPVTPADAASAFDQIRRSLRVLVGAEQGFYAENGAYTEDLGALGFRPTGQSQVRFLWLTPRGWAASGSHPALPGRDCVVYVGEANAPPTTLRYTRSGREGVVVCDMESAPRPTNPAGSAAPAPPPADTASALDAVNPTVQMRVDLRNLARSQEAYFATQGAYSPRPERLQIQFLWHRGVKVTILHADRVSWAARATHVSRPGKSCVAWFGSPSTRPATEADRSVPRRSGVPVCDR